MWQFTAVLTRWGCTPASACCLLLLPLVVSDREKTIKGKWDCEETDRNMQLNPNQTVLFGILGLTTDLPVGCSGR